VGTLVIYGQTIGVPTIDYEDTFYSRSQCRGMPGGPVKRKSESRELRSTMKDKT